MVRETTWIILFLFPPSIVGTIGSRLLPFIIKPGTKVAHVRDRNKRNDLVLRTLLRNSQAAIQKA